MENRNPELTTTLTLLALAVLKERSLADDLQRLVRLATHHLRTSSGASIALLIDGQPSTVAITDHVALELDLTQYNVDEGPCITALAGRAIRVGYLSEDERFPHFAAGAADQRVLSVLSTPITYDDAVIGTLNVYSRQADAFDDNDQNTADLVCAEAANAIARSEIFSAAKTIRSQLQAEYDERSLVACAQGVLVALQDCSTDQAFRLIRNAADANAEALLVTAQRILDAAIDDQHNPKP
ncbi:MAG: GAF domain-containing protein [Ilumatobacteraceae bacterium]